MLKRSLVVLSFAALALGAQDKKGVLSPEDQLKAFRVFPGLEATTWATEPGFSNPTCMDIDERGRVWVAESVNYRGSKLRPEGDRIMILEDTDLDGKADSYKVFVQDKAITGPLGICVLGNKVYVAQSPKMTVYTIDESGDKPVGTPELLFDGFGGVNHDHGLHSIMFGPDGRFYFNGGNDGCRGAEIKNGKGEPILDSTNSGAGGKGKTWRGGPAGGAGKRYQEGMAFRCNPDGTGFETLGHNFRNNYEVAADSFGTAWQSDNDDDGNQGVRINYVMEGGSFGYNGYAGGNWGRDQGAYPGQLRQEAHFHQRDPGVVPNLLCTGGGSPTGILVNEGDLLGDKLKGALIHCDAGPNVVRAYFPTPSGGGYSCGVADVVKSSHTWFRPADVCIGVDGALFVADWTDAGVGGHATADKDLTRISGRIYRVAPMGNKPAKPAFDLSSVKGQIDALLSPNLARRYAAYQKLLAGGEAELKELFKTSKDARHRARALWLLARKSPDHVTEALKDKDVDIRIAALRAARVIKMDMIAIAKQMLGDESLGVAREVALAMNYQPTDKALDILVALCDRMSPPVEVGEQPKVAGNYQPDSELEQWRQKKYQHKWYLEALGIGAIGREKEVLEAWQKNGKNKDAKVAELIAWRLNRVIPDAPPPPPKGK